MGRAAQTIDDELCGRRICPIPGRIQIQQPRISNISYEPADLALQPAMGRCGGTGREDEGVSIAVGFTLIDDVRSEHAVTTVGRLEQHH